MNMNALHHPSRGLTLIEVLVSISIFSIVMVVSVGALVSINDTNQETQLQRTITDNLNFALENMARNLRVGTNYHCDFNVSPIGTPRDCASGASSIVFEGYKGNPTNPGDQIAYRLNSATGIIERSLDAGGIFYPLTSSELDVENLLFYVTGTGANDLRQPAITIVVSGTATFKDGAVMRFNLQTAVSQRKLDS